MSMNTKSEARNYTDGSISSLSGSSQTLLAANPRRRFLLIHNINAANPITVNLTGGTAAANTQGCIRIAAGNSLIIDNHCPNTAITVIGTALDKVTAYEA